MKGNPIYPKQKLTSDEFPLHRNVCGKIKQVLVKRQILHVL